MDLMREDFSISFAGTSSGSGVVYLRYGEIFGGDNVFAYRGTYEITPEGALKAEIKTTRHGSGPSIYGTHSNDDTIFSFYSVPEKGILKGYLADPFNAERKIAVQLKRLPK